MLQSVLILVSIQVFILICLLVNNVLCVFIYLLLDSSVCLISKMENQTDSLINESQSEQSYFTTCVECGHIGKPRTISSCKSCRSALNRYYGIKRKHKPCVKCGNIGRYNDGKCKTCTKICGALRINKVCTRCNTIDRALSGHCNTCRRIS